MKLLLLILPLAFAGPKEPEETFKTLTTTVSPGASIDWVGEQTKLTGEGKLKRDVKLPEAILVGGKMKPESLFSAGHVQVISVVPSLDTPVCDRQTHILAESKTLSPKVERITISRDLPYAQRRFADADEKLKTVRYLSDYKTGDFGKMTGLELERNSLLARALIVLDAEGVVRHYQIVPEIYALPDMEKAFAVANSLVK
ncbi:MAG: redoxin family protein [Bdellovibrionia bacterium]